MISPKQLILVVEDSDEDFEATQRALKKSNLINPVHRCIEGDDALDYLFNRGDYQCHETYPKPGFILLDLNLPGTDGREVLQVIKSDEHLKKIPVVVFTTSSDISDIDSCYEIGANSYVHKPLDLVGLFQAIGRLKDYWFEVVVLPKPIED